MAIRPDTKYPGKISPATPAYPYGSARNVTVPGDGTGTPWEKDLVNDVFGFQQALLSASGIVPSGNPDEVGNSQYLSALLSISSRSYPTVSDMISDSEINVGVVVSTQGYYEKGDGGGNTYEIVAAGTGADDGGEYINLTTHQAKGLFYQGVVDVRQYGAKGDGVNDDTDFIQSAYGSSFGKIFHSDGVYMVRAQPEADYLTPTSNKVLEFSGGAIIKSISNSVNTNVLLNITGSNTIVIGGTFDGNRAAHTGSPAKHHGIRIEGNIQNVKVIGSHVKDALGDGFKVQDAGTPSGTAESPFGVELTSISTDNCGRQGLAVTGCKGLNLNGGYFRGTNGNNPESGIDLEPDAANIVTNINLSNITTEGNSGGGLVIGNNQISEVNISNLISLDDGEQGINISRNAKNINIDGFIVKGSVLQGVRITNDDPAKSCENISLSDGRIISPQSTGITVQDSGGPITGVRLSNIRITNNMTGDAVALLGVSSAILDGIHVDTTPGSGINASSCDEIKISDSSVSGAASRGISIVSSNRAKINSCETNFSGLDGIRISNSSDCMISSGEYRSSSQLSALSNANVILSNADNCLINGIRSSRDSGLANQPSYAIEISGTTDTAQVRNSFIKDGGATGVILDSGTNTVTSNNLDS